jgi:acetyltransferase-like isoleucine patch superfamily enzyme
MLIISPTARISPLADIEDSTVGTKIIVGDGAVIDAFVKIKPAGGKGDVVVGPGSYINSGCVLYTGHGIKIGANVLIAANCTLAPTNHEIRDRTRLIREQGFSPSRGGIVIEDDVWIGANSVILDGAVLRRGSVVGAGSVVRHELPEYSINVGVPARTIAWRE